MSCILLINLSGLKMNLQVTLSHGVGAFPCCGRHLLSARVFARE